MNQTLKINFDSNSKILNEFCGIMKEDPSVESVTRRIDGRITRVSIIVVGGSQETLDKNFQYVLGASHYTRKVLEAKFPRTTKNVADYLMRLSYMSGLREDMQFTKEEKITSALANVLSQLWAEKGINPIELAELAVEDLNEHDLAAELRKLRN